MSDPERARNPVEQLAEEFLSRYRRGDRPPLTEYTERHPELAEKIRELFPTLLLLEDFGASEGTPPEDNAGQPTADGKLLKRLGDYRIIREVGRGGMGIVYLAEEESLGRYVALKVLPYHAQVDANQRRRFRREARAAAQLHHTNIVPVFGVGEQDGIQYYAMQFINGQGLDVVLQELTRMRNGPGTSPPGQPSSDGKCDSMPGRGLSATLAWGMCSGVFQKREGVSPARAERSGPPRKHDSLAEPDQRLQIGEEIGDADQAVGKEARCESPGGWSSPEQRSADASSTELMILTESDGHYYRSVARIGVQVAEALTYAHSQEILHRDIKPSNLLLDVHGTAWLTDFGLAKPAGDDLTHTGNVVGTLRYMAPERFRGWADPRSDVYSLGLALYEFLTLKPAFAGSDQAGLMEQIGRVHPQRPRKVDARVPRDLETIVLKAIDKEPSHRYQTAAEMAEDLRLFLGDKPIQARRASPAERLWRWSRRNPLLATLAASVTALLLLLAMGGWSATAVLGHQASQLLNKTEALTGERDAVKRALYESYVQQARALRLSGRSGQRFESLAALKEAIELRGRSELTDDETLSLRNEAIACMALPDVRPIEKHKLGEPTPDSRMNILRVAPDFKRFALGDPQGNIRIHRVSDAKQITTLPGHGLVIWEMRFFPDRRYLAATYHNRSTATTECRVWDLRRREVVLTTAAESGGVDTTSDGRLFIPQADGTIHVFKFPSAKPLDSIATHAGSSIINVDIHPDGEKLAFHYRDDRAVYVLELKTGEQLAKFDHPATVTSIRWDPRGELLATTCDDMAAHVWHFPTRREQSVLRGHVGRVTGVTFDRAGDLLMTSGWADTTRLWDPMSGQQRVRTDTTFLQYGPRDERLMSSDGSSYEIWEVATGGECRLYHEPGPRDFWKGPWCVDVSPNGRLMATANGIDSVRIWDLSLHREVAVLPAGAARVPLFHPDGKSLFVAGCRDVKRWPLAVDTEANVLRIGKAETLYQADPPLDFVGASLGGNGRWLLHTASHQEAHAVHLDQLGGAKQEPKVVRLEGLVTPSQLSVSPDGKWAATGGDRTDVLKIWDLHQKVVVKQWQPGPYANPVFSPDGKWLVVSTSSDYQFREVEGWQLRRRIRRVHTDPRPAPIAISPDSRLVAVVLRRNEVQLIEPATGRPVAALKSPTDVMPRSLCFTPDASRLAVASGTGTVQVWDLRRIRRQLDELGLDWQPPPAYDDSEITTDAAPEPLKVEIELGQ